MNTGRRKDDIWKYFIEVPFTKNTMKSKRAVCKRCKIEMNAFVARMRTHYYETCCGLNHREDLNSFDQSMDLPGNLSLKYKIYLGIKNLLNNLQNNYKSVTKY